MPQPAAILSNLADSSVDLVACSQSLHWMDPEETHPDVVAVK